MEKKYLTVILPYPQAQQYTYAQQQSQQNQHWQQPAQVRCGRYGRSRWDPEEYGRCSADGLRDAIHDAAAADWRHGRVR